MIFLVPPKTNISIKASEKNSKINTSLTIWRLLLFGEVSDNVRPLAIHLAEDVEEKGIHVEVEGLVIQEELGQEAETLAIQLVVLPIDLPDGEGPLPVDLLPGRLAGRALTQMISGILISTICLF